MFAFSSSVLAAGSVGYRTIDEVAFNTGGFFLYSAEGWVNARGCDRTDAVVLLDNGPNYDKAYALALTAYASGKQLVGFSDNCVVFDDKSYNMIRSHKYLRVK